MDNQYWITKMESWRVSKTKKTAFSHMNSMVFIDEYCGILLLMIHVTEMHN